MKRIGTCAVSHDRIPSQVANEATARAGGNRTSGASSDTLR